MLCVCSLTHGVFVQDKLARSLKQGDHIRSKIGTPPAFGSSSAGVLPCLLLAPYMLHALLLTLSSLSFPSAAATEETLRGLDVEDNTEEEEQRQLQKKQQIDNQRADVAVAMAVRVLFRLPLPFMPPVILPAPFCSLACALTVLRVHFSRSLFAAYRSVCAS